MREAKSIGAFIVRSLRDYMKQNAFTFFQVDWGLSVRCGGRFAYTCKSSQLIADDAAQSISRSTAGEIKDGARAERPFDSGTLLFFSGCAGAMKLIAKGAINTGE